VFLCSLTDSASPLHVFRGRELYGRMALLAICPCNHIPQNSVIGCDNKANRLHPHPRMHEMAIWVVRCLRVFSVTKTGHSRSGVFNSLKRMYHRCPHMTSVNCALLKLVSIIFSHLIISTI